ncbi:hypothetical protein [Pseudoalteromonas luteoviolacea]|uniref:hypothetical protein n=1 Tax=Pseudoalteromonas luteoviolacea TaxID=43657 RepID=UPI001B38FF43|nr:hypothetical protein [Pseudoalteromonas luteoviolacea]MBQ4834920.1 hypothetical protein [Pseudoalteromonas luteoviolacea]
MSNTYKFLPALGLLSAFAAHATTPQPHPLKVHAQQHIADSIAWIDEQGISCEQNTNSHPMCDTVKVYFDDGEFDPSRTSSKQTILVMDYGMDLQTVLRYRSRIKSAYKYDPDTQTFVADNPSVSISRLGQKVLSDIDGFTYTDQDTGAVKPGFLPAAWLGDLAAKYVGAASQDKYDHETGAPHFSHGTKVFGYLAQHNPDAEFVIIDTSTFSPFIMHKDDICSRNIDAFYVKMERAAGSLLRDIIEVNDIEYINYSGGFERRDVQTAWESNKCSGSLSNSRAKRFVQSIRPVYDKLFSTYGVLGIHAGAASATSSENPLDVIDYQNRIRVMSYTTGSVDTQISQDAKTGWQDVFVNHTSEFDGHKYIDMYINFGYGRSAFWETNSTPKMASDVYGMRYGADWEFPSSSWAAPIATSYAIAIQSQMEWGFDPAYLKRTLISQDCYDNGGHFINFALSDFIYAGNGHCRLQDPLKYRLDTLNQQGYLK